MEFFIIHRKEYKTKFNSMYWQYRMMDKEGYPIGWLFYRKKDASNFIKKTKMDTDIWGVRKVETK